MENDERDGLDEDTRAAKAAQRARWRAAWQVLAGAATLLAAGLVGGLAWAWAGGSTPQAALVAAGTVLLVMLASGFVKLVHAVAGLIQDGAHTRSLVERLLTLNQQLTDEIKHDRAMRRESFRPPVPGQRLSN